ncbi:FkbM family methyltransferase [Brachyspira aalborgi]|uniref:FkbM family methyltransferase n=1 Tax=Brachyspira aalborgi TaxID=29522 RepID=A0A5C8F6H7_9SPIR|nr:FkbM family methyltransferase [Brachyspira aalborgi]TXJ44180.1 FkbM family methyltransferase [Brachyspira aalborgi]
MNIKDFIYSKKDEGIYRKRTIFGIKIITKPYELILNNKLDRILHDYDNLIRGGGVNRLNNILTKKYLNENYIYTVNIDNNLFHFQDSILSESVNMIAHELNNNEYDFNIDFKEGDIVIDIGANVGMVSILLAKKFPFLKIYSFEPLKENYDNFIKNIELNNIPKGVITAENKAVTKDGRLITMSINSANKGGSSTTDVISINSIMTKENSQVESITLEEIFKKYNINKLKLLKIDCEGSEYEILYNADTNLLKNIENLRGEFHENKNLTDEYDIDKLCEYVSKYIKNYKVTKARHCFVM